MTYEPGTVVTFCIQPHTDTWALGRVIRLLDKDRTIYRVRTLAPYQHQVAHYRRYGGDIRPLDAVTRLGLIVNGFGDYELDARTEDVISQLGVLTEIDGEAPAEVNPAEVYLYTATGPSLSSYSTYQWTGESRIPGAGDRVEVGLTNLTGRVLVRRGTLRKTHLGVCIVDLDNGDTVEVSSTDVRRIDAITELGRLAEG